MYLNSLMEINRLSCRERAVKFLIKRREMEMGQLHFVDVQTIEDWGIGVKFFRLRSDTIF